MCHKMDIQEIFRQYPYFREAATAFVVIFVNICALVILIAAGRERRRGDRRWAKESKVKACVRACVRRQRGRMGHARISEWENLQERMRSRMWRRTNNNFLNK